MTAVPRRGRRAGRLLAASLVGGVLAAPALSVAAAPASAAPAAAAPAPVRVACETSDRRLAELSGLAWAPDGLRAVVDSGRTARVFRLADDCTVADVRSVPVDPWDLEDLARAPGGTLWLADVGDNARTRDTIALVEVPPAGSARLHRATYPDGPHDAEALLLAGDGTPVVVTKEPGGAAGVYAAPGPGTALATPGPTALRRVGTVVPPPSATPGGPMGPFGGRVVTGGAVSPDGRVAVLRTYTDAWLYPVTGGDVVGALRGTPAVVPLPDEPQGEAVALTPEGTLLSASESTVTAAGQLRAVDGAALAETAGSPPGSSASRGALGRGDAREPAGAPGHGGVPLVVATVAAVAVGVLVVAGLVVVVVRRRRDATPG